MKKDKKNIKIIINKKYKENMSEEPETKAKKNNQKDEEFKWINDKDISIKQKYVSFPLDDWKQIMLTKFGNQ